MPSVDPHSDAAGLGQDWAVNRADPRAQFVLAFFRLAHRAAGWSRLNPARILVGVAYRALVTYVMGIELPWRTQVGPRLRLFHGVGLVVNDGCVIGSDVVLRHGVTLGHKTPGGACPVIGDRVEFGANAIVLGGVTIGNDAVIGAGSVVTTDVEPGATFVGNPARRLP